jgi:hypothetical protein
VSVSVCGEGRERDDPAGVDVFTLKWCVMMMMMIPQDE